MNDIIPFTYEDTPVRVLTINEAPWWVAADVATPLALANIRSSLALLDDDEKGVHTVDTPSGAQQMAYQPDARENREHGHGDQARIAGRGEEGHRGVARCRGGTEQIGSRSAIIDPGVHGRRDSASGDRRGAWRTPECDLPDSQPRLDCKYPACALQASGVPLVAQAPRLHQQGKKNAEAHRRQTIRLSDTRNSAAPAYGAAHPTANRSAA